MLQRRVSMPEEPEEENVSEETEDKDKPKFEYFAANPEEVRAKSEQWRRDHYRGRGRGHSGSQRDVVGKQNRSIVINSVMSYLKLCKVCEKFCWINGRNN